MFAFVVITYVTSAAGMPIYRHYCGGELEKTSYLIKGKTCCGDMASKAKDENGCCRDESQLLKNNNDFAMKPYTGYTFPNHGLPLFFQPLLFSIYIFPHNIAVIAENSEEPPPKLQTTRLISTSVLRI